MFQVHTDQVIFLPSGPEDLVDWRLPSLLTKEEFVEYLISDAEVAIWLIEPAVVWTQVPPRFIGKVPVGSSVTAIFPSCRFKLERSMVGVTVSREEISPTVEGKEITPTAQEEATSTMEEGSTAVRGKLVTWELLQIQALQVVEYAVSGPDVVVRVADQGGPARTGKPKFVAILPVGGVIVATYPGDRHYEMKRSADGEITVIGPDGENAIESGP